MEVNQEGRRLHIATGDVAEWQSEWEMVNMILCIFAITVINCYIMCLLLYCLYCIILAFYYFYLYTYNTICCVWSIYFIYFIMFYHPIFGYHTFLHSWLLDRAQLPSNMVGEGFVAGGCLSLHNLWGRNAWKLTIQQYLMNQTAKKQRTVTRVTTQHVAEKYKQGRNGRNIMEYQRVTQFQDFADSQLLVLRSSITRWTIYI